MKTISKIIPLLILLVPCQVFAEYKPDPLELAPAEKISCSWGKLDAAAYKECQERRKFFNKMTKEEKHLYNQEAEKRRTDARLNRIERVIPGIPVDDKKPN